MLEAVHHRGYVYTHSDPPYLFGGLVASMRLLQRPAKVLVPLRRVLDAHRPLVVVVVVVVVVVMGGGGG